MERVALGIVLLWATVGRAADSTIGDFGLGGLGTRQASPALAIEFTSPGPSGLTEARGGGGVRNHAGSTDQAFDSLRGLFDASAILERSAPLDGDLHQDHRSSGDLSGASSVAPAPSVLSYQIAEPHGSVPQVLNRSSAPPGFVKQRSAGPGLAAIFPWAGLVAAGLLLIGIVAAAGSSRAA